MKFVKYAALSLTDGKRRKTFSLAAGLATSLETVSIEKKAINILAFSANYSDIISIHSTGRHFRLASSILGNNQKTTFGFSQWNKLRVEKFLESFLDMSLMFQSFPKDLGHYSSLVSLCK